MNIRFFSDQQIISPIPNLLYATDKNKAMQLQPNCLYHTSLQRAKTTAIIFTPPSKQKYFQNIMTCYKNHPSLITFLLKTSFRLKWYNTKKLNDVNFQQIWQSKLRFI